MRTLIVATALVMSAPVWAQDSSNPQAVTSGVAVTGLSDSAGGDRYFYIDVPANTGALRVELNVANGDPDLFVDTNNPPELAYPGSAICASYNPPTENELCTINNPAAGRYYIRVNAWESYTDVSLVATVPPDAPTVTQLTPDVESLSVAFESSAAGQPGVSFTAICSAVGSQKLSVEEISAKGAKGALQSRVLEEKPRPAKARTAASTMGEASIFQRLSDGSVVYKQQSYPDLTAFHGSQRFADEGLRCGATEAASQLARLGVERPGLTAQQRMEDCTTSITQINSSYAPLLTGDYVIPVYFHVIYRSNGEGWISEQRIADQMAALNEDFAGAVGLGTDTSVAFSLQGITYTENDEWFTDSAEDQSAYKAALGRDQSRFLNIYTNDAGGGGVLGYAYFPQEAAGSVVDGVVMLHETIGGRSNGYGSYDEGRTLVHEIGHYLGLFHTFAPDASPTCSNSYTTGDLIVDTPAQAEADQGCDASTSCGVRSAIENFMNYSFDDCMYTFSAEQTNRMICGLTSYRPSGYSRVDDGSFSASGASSPLLVSGLTAGDTYECRVLATNAAGTSDPSNALQGVPSGMPESLPVWLLYEAAK